ncbi:MAG TPA: ankyrin repeat domain-containing protein [Chitinophagaceae bacterium]|nr:ankyrin repeat domain-containing protein [Chitinophagaceae bacterium]
MRKNTYYKKFLRKTTLLVLISPFFVLNGQGQKKLLEAIEKKDTVTFTNILSSGINVNKRRVTIETRYGISRKRKLRNGTVIKDKSRRRGIPLIYFRRSEFPLTQAAFYNNFFFVQQLLKHGAKPDKKRNHVLPPLAWAAHNGNLELVKLLLEYKADINGSEKSWRTTPLIEAIEWKHWEVATYLLNNGADINRKDRNGKTALSHAAIHKNFEFVKILVDRNADVNHRDKEGAFILEDACSDDHLFAETTTRFDVIRYLVEHGASTNNAAINKVLAKGEAEIAKYLLSKGAPVSNKLVIDASNGRNFSLFRYLIDTLKLDIHFYDSTSYWGGNVLHRVCSGYWGDSSIRRINIPMLEYILEKGMNVNDTNERGQTPLLLLIEYGKKDKDTKAASELLVSKGADVNVSGGDMNFSPLMHAATSKLLETAKFLIEHGANVNYKEREDRTILHWAAWTYDNIEMIKLLAGNGADLNAIEGREGETPALHCVVFSRWENIKALLGLGANPNIKDKRGHTLLDAVSDEELKELIIKKGGKSGQEIN